MATDFDIAGGAAAGLCLWRRCPPFLFTRMAEHQAAVVLKNALFHWPAKVERRVVPWCIFTDPELARVGLSDTIHIYPTLAQINRRVADERLKAALTPARKRWLKRLFSLRGAA